MCEDAMFYLSMGEWLMGLRSSEPGQLGIEWLLWWRRGQDALGFPWYISIMMADACGWPGMRALADGDHVLQASDRASFTARTWTEEI